MRDVFTELLEIAERAPSGLGELCARIATLLGVPICSVYVRERDGARRVSGVLVLRATFGQPQESVDRVRLRVGEGLTGFAVECLRPVTVARAVEDARNRAFDGLDESTHPSLLAVPLVDGGTAIGALVLQRAEIRAFDTVEVALAQALAVPVVHALERIRAVGHAELQARAQRPAEATLRGRGVVHGSALGTAAVRVRSLSVAARPGPIDPAEERTRLGRAIAETAEDIAALESWAMHEAPLDRTTTSTLLSTSRFILEDARLRGQLMRAVQEGLAAERAVERVIAEYVRNLGGRDAALAERALEVEALGLRVLARLAEGATALQPGTILCASRITACDVLELASQRGLGAVLEGPPEASPGLPLAVALQLPVLADVEGLFRWVSTGDRVLLRADDGIAVVNPSRVDVAAYRRE